MISFLLTNWWIYIPIIFLLLFLTARNNQRIKYIKQTRSLQGLTPEERQKKLDEIKNNPSGFDKLTAKVGLKGILTYIFPKK